MMGNTFAVGAQSVVPPSSAESDNDGPLRVLWVGNSYTFKPQKHGGIPGVLSRLAAASGAEDMEHVLVLRGCAGLASLADEFQAAMRGQGTSFDVVVLQDQSMTPAGGAVGKGGPGRAREAALKALSTCYAPLLCEESYSGGVLLYQTWGRPAAMHGQPEILGDFEEMSRRTAEGYRAYGETLLGEGVPRLSVAACGDAYLRLAAERPDGARLLPHLYSDDIGHPTAAAALLVACVFARALARLPWRQGDGGARQGGLEPSRAAVAAVAAELGVKKEMVDPICRAALP